MKLKLKSVYVGILSLFLWNCSAANSAQDPNNLSQKYDIVVDAKGAGDFATVQEAINSVPFLKQKETKIYIKNGIYKEKLDLPKDKINVTLIGEDKTKTILTYDDYASKKNAAGANIGTSGSCSFAVGADNFKAENITFENSSGPVGQAVAVRIDGDKVIFNNCNFLGFQDTVYTRADKSRQYYKNCYMEGTTDFIFGASTALFEDCEIFSKQGGAYITAASTSLGTSYGYVFLNCKLTTNTSKGSVYLGRPWRNDAKTVFIKCEMGEHINPLGWSNWGRTEAESTTFYAEYECSGKGADRSSRVNWSHTLTAQQFSTDYTMDKIFKDWDPIL
ncbi:pectinesterase [Flavobacterium fluvii]|uniref:Pectinesterase n=1 Tax=Flavobacterium fluvii TaxID=468056 RepID=A0A1M5LQU3_9FLAO|nr:pectinesterase family protein [Flavobacterium fluvii]SHG67009.1 pectinesterase [Flavobacterium fluvii]